MAQKRTNTLVKLAGIGLLILLLGFSLGRLPSKVGKMDFRAYWSASYLLGRGENFADEDQLLSVQQELTGFNRDYAMNTWNPPWILLWLMPYTWAGFETAVNLWLFTNMGMLFFSITMGWQMLYPSPKEGKKWLWLYLLAAMLFPSTIVSLMFGQVNLMVLGGLVGFLAYYAQGRDLTAGFMLALTTFKPHLVYLVLPIILLHAWRRRRWGVWVTFFGVLVVSTAVVFILRPTLFTDYFQGTAAGNLFAWETATLATYLSIITGWMWLRWMAVALLPMALLAWLYKGQNWDLMMVAQVGTLFSIITMPFGWSYDFVLLLLPLMQLLAWLVSKQLPVAERLVVLLILGITYAVYYYQRIETPSELYFFWVPLVIAAVYAWLAWRQQVVKNI